MVCLLYMCRVLVSKRQQCSTKNHRKNAIWLQRVGPTKKNHVAQMHQKNREINRQRLLVERLQCQTIFRIHSRIGMIALLGQIRMKSAEVHKRIIEFQCWVSKVQSLHNFLKSTLAGFLYITIILYLSLSNQCS